LFFSAGVALAASTVVRLEQIATAKTNMPKMNLPMSLISTSTQH
jgi:hypothetical protein